MLAVSHCFVNGVGCPILPTRNFIAKQSDVLDPSVVFAMMRARRFDSPSRPMRELNAIQRARWSAPPTDNVR